jgi:hypothetical protein
MTKTRKTAILKAYARRRTLFMQTTITDEMRQQYPHLAHCRAIYSNSRMEVQLFACESPIGGVMQTTLIRHGDIEKLSWQEIQDSLHEIFGPDAVAVEVYPAIVNEWQTKTGLRVLWVLPGTWELPFGLHLPNAWGKPNA